MALGIVNVAPPKKQSDYVLSEELDTKLNTDFSNVDADAFKTIVENLGMKSVPEWASAPTKPVYSAEEISIPEVSREALEGDDVLEILTNLRSGVFRLDNMINFGAGAHIWEKYQISDTVYVPSDDYNEHGPQLSEASAKSTSSKYNASTYPSAKDGTVTIFDSYTTAGNGFIAGTVVQTLTVNTTTSFANYVGKYFMVGAQTAGTVTSTIYEITSRTEPGTSGRCTGSNIVNGDYTDAKYYTYLHVERANRHDHSKALIENIVTDSYDAYEEGVMYDGMISYVYVGSDSAKLAKIEYGSYIGTGEYGSASPTEITFSNNPFVVVVDKHTFVKGMETLTSGSILSSSTLYITLAGNKLSYYNDDSAANQLNTSGTTYRYIALS